MPSFQSVWERLEASGNFWECLGASASVWERLAVTERGWAADVSHVCFGFLRKAVAREQRPMCYMSASAA